MDIQIKTSYEQIKEELKSLILENFSNEDILFLLPGGSAAKLGVELINGLPDDLKKRIIVSLTDERFGDVGHADSNWVLIESLKLDKKLGRIPVLIDDNPENTALKWADELNKTVATSKVIALFGIGEDYHIAGIKPGFDLGVGTAVVEYQAADFHRITIAPEFFRNIDLAVVYAEGTNKADAVNQLKTDNNTAVQPLQLVKDSKQALVYYYNK